MQFQVLWGPELWQPAPVTKKKMDGANSASGQEPVWSRMAPVVTTPMMPGIAPAVLVMPAAPRVQPLMLRAWQRRVTAVTQRLQAAVAQDTQLMPITMRAKPYLAAVAHGGVTSPRGCSTCSWPLMLSAMCWADPGMPQLSHTRCIQGAHLTLTHRPASEKLASPRHPVMRAAEQVELLYYGSHSEFAMNIV